MAIKHAKATHYKENIETKTKKLDDKSVTPKQKIVIQQDIDKLKEKHKNHVKAVDKDFDEQIIAAPTEMKKELEKEREAFKSKYVVKEDKAAAVKEVETQPDDQNGKSQDNETNTNIETPVKSDTNTETPVVNNNTEIKVVETNSNLTAKINEKETKPDDQNGKSQDNETNTNIETPVKSDTNTETSVVNNNTETPVVETKTVATAGSDATGATAGSDATGAIKEAIKNGKYYGFKNLTVQKFVDAKNIDIEKVPVNNQSVAEFYASVVNNTDVSVVNYSWNNTDASTKEQKCKIEICRKITEIEDISKVINYVVLGINQNDNSHCYNNDSSRVTFGDDTTIMSYWEIDCQKLLSEEALITQ
ncbi:hypothetical protein N3Z17_06015 [Candidatus Bandiella numerosa]|uniref:hypothetical protein n=1 Tax=Candidatus Bandiella numerosa TaxID=2570586 RepID=UPI00249E6FE8|nr:hypothetical protein [Candidatus Bandiella numerosa]WHA04773.1 hypothetical protein N3Z17_06015 [Candidatus Bandiella numerosa]